MIELLNDLETTYGPFETWKYELFPVTVDRYFVCYKDGVSVIFESNFMSRDYLYTLKIIKYGRTIVDRKFRVNKTTNNELFNKLHHIKSRLKKTEKLKEQAEEFKELREDEDQARRNLGLPPKFQWDLFYDVA